MVCNVDQPPSTHIGSPGTAVAEDDVFGVVLDDIVAGCVVDNVFDRHVRRPETVVVATDNVVVVTVEVAVLEVSWC